MLSQLSYPKPRPSKMGKSVASAPPCQLTGRAQFVHGLSSHRGTRCGRGSCLAASLGPRGAGFQSAQNLRQVENLPHVARGSRLSEEINGFALSGQMLMSTKRG